MLRPEASTNTPNEDYSSDMFYMPKFTAPARELLRPPKSAVPHFELFVRFREVRSKAKRYDTDRYRRSSGAASTDRPSPKPNDEGLSVEAAPASSFPSSVAVAG